MTQSPRSRGQYFEEGGPRGDNHRPVKTGRSQDAVEAAALVKGRAPLRFRRTGAAQNKAGPETCGPGAVHTLQHSEVAVRHMP